MVWFTDVELSDEGFATKFDKIDKYCAGWKLPAGSPVRTVDKNASVFSKRRDADT